MQLLEERVELIDLGRVRGMCGIAIGAGGVLALVLLLDQSHGSNGSEPSGGIKVHVTWHKSVLAGGSTET